MSATQLAAHLQGSDALLVDVREPWEFDICRIENCINIPLGQIAHRIDEFEGVDEIVVICHHGVRSQYAIRFLEQQSIEDLINLDGGVDAWAREVDPDMPVY